MLRYDVTLAALLMLPCLSSKAVPLPLQHGQLNVQGQIQASPCNLHTDDIRQEVAFDALSHRSVKGEAAHSIQILSLRLVNCRLEHDTGYQGNSVSITFDGEPAPGNSTLFAVTGSARGLALKLTDSQGHQAIPGMPMPAIGLDGADNELHYRLQVVSNTEAFREGDWTGTVRFMLAYQ